MCQSDPISPYIYIMCEEGLSSILRRNEKAGLLHGCIIARGEPIISHLFFADDFCFFFRANGVKASVLNRILNIYEKISGQKINYNKSALTFSPSTNDSSKREVCERLRVRACQSPGKYLGIPMVVGRNKNTTLYFLT